MKKPEANDRSKSRPSRLVLPAGVLLFLLLLAGRAFALDPSRDISQYNCQNWSRQNGLPLNGINAIAQTQDGYLWLGTAAGMVRFDGTEFKLIDLANLPQVGNTRVTSLAAAKAGGLWVGLENSAFGSYDGETFSFLGKEAWGGVNLNVNSIFEGQDQSLWIVAERHLARLTPAGVFEDMLSLSNNSYFNGLSGFADAQGRVWYGAADGGAADVRGVHYWQAGKITKLPDPVLDGALVYALAMDTNGQVWVGTSLGLFCYDSNLKRKETPPMPDEVRALLVDRHGVVWFGTSGHGLGRYQDGQFSYLGREQGLAGDYVKALAEDHEGSLWIGTRSGLSQLTDVKFATEHAAEDPTVMDALSVAPARDGGVWVGSGKGLTHLDDTVKTYWTESGLPNEMVKRVFEASNGDVYLVCGSSDLVVFSAGKVVAKYAATNMVVGLAEDAHGVVASVGASLYRVGTNYFTPYVFTNGEPGLWWVLNLASGRDGEIWVACGAGIFRVKDGGYQQCGAAKDLPDTRVQGLCEDSDGVVWGWLLTGICRLKDNQIRFVDRQHGLLDNDIYAVVPDDFGNLWVDSGRGIFRVAKKDMNDFMDGKTGHVQCDVYDGPSDVKFTDKTIQERVGCKSSDGRIWFASPNGVVVVDPADVPNNPFAPPVHITSLRVNGVEFDKSKKVVAPPGKGELEIHFAALSFVAPHQVRFRYRLEGYDKDLVEATDRHMAFYTNLKPGSYRFQVQACNQDGVWNTLGDSLSFQLSPHFYESAWFLGLTGLLGGFGLFGVYVWRVRVLRSKQQKLQQAHDLLESQVARRTAELQGEIEERKRMEAQVERVHRDMLDISRQAGMAEVATGILHNVGNVLNSVNVSASLVCDRLKKSKSASVGRVADLMREHAGDLGEFITRDPKGRLLPSYLSQLGGYLATEQSAVLDELATLRKNVEHINDIVAMQQSNARGAGIAEKVRITDLIEEALHMNESSLARHAVRVVRQYDESLAEVNVERHKVIQILVNLICNARQACEASPVADKAITLRAGRQENFIRVAVSDNGVGIPAENLTRVFSHGFTTKKDGHGFGLHCSALAAQEMGGGLHAESAGAGKGASFVLTIPAQEAPAPAPARGENGSAAHLVPVLEMEAQPR